MSSPSKPTIPAWQLATQSQKETTSKAEAQQEEPAKVADGTSDPISTNAQQESSTKEQEQDIESPTGIAVDDLSGQLEQVKKFLEDPTVKNSPVEKQHQFLRNKGIPDFVIEQHVAKEDVSFQASAFNAFQDRSKPQSQPPSQPSQQQNAPPIITYPEFLAQAHKPPPLITPTRVLNTAYFASATAALIYGVSTFLVKPMEASLTGSRHDFATHSQSKIDEMNERLSKIVSRIPEPKPSPETDMDDVESITSDPTELYHRDMGTQTSPSISRAPSDSEVTPTKTATEKQRERLSIIGSHLSEILSGLERGDTAVQERQDGFEKTKHYLDLLQFGGDTKSSAWGSTIGVEGTEKGKEDAIEGLKKEIRGVKGVLLSAKRFPSAMAGARLGT